MADPTQDTSISAAETRAFLGSNPLGGTSPRLPPSIKIPPSTGDPLQDSMNLQAVLAQAINGNLPEEERGIAFTAYQAASDDVSRLTNERLKWNAEQGQLQGKYDADAAKTNQPESLSATTAAPYILTRMPDGSLKQEPNPNYVPPRAPAGPAAPAFSGTPAGLEYASNLRMKEARDQLQAEVEKNQQLVSLGLMETPEQTRRNKAALDIAISSYTESQTALRDAEKYNRDLPTLQAEETRARNTDWRAQQADERANRQMAMQNAQYQAGNLMDQSRMGQSALWDAAKSGVAPTIEQVRALQIDPLRRAQELMAQFTKQSAPQASAPPPQTSAYAPIDIDPLKRATDLARQFMSQQSQPTGAPRPPGAPAP